MQYIRINEINIENKDKFDKYHYYFNNELKEIELNKGFTLTKQVLSQIFELNTTNNILITIIAIDDKLNYFIGYDSELDINFSNVNVEKLELKKINFKYKSKIYGVVNPLNINLREMNLIDELLIENRGSDFALQIEIEKDLEMKESTEYLSEIADVIEELSSKSEVNISEQDWIGKNIWKGIKGGQGKSFKKERVDGKKELLNLKEKYEVLAVNQNKMKMTSINIFTNDLEIYKRIQSKIIAYSKMNIGNSIFFVSKDKEYLNDVKFCVFDYIIPIVAFPISNVAGLTVSSKCEYGADILPKSDSNIILGKLNKNGKTKIDINYDINDLLMHTFVTGVTGSGKTSTVKKIISEIYKEGKPFLIMEPAKSEYKYLSNIINIKRYQLGIETENSFRLNPFEFPKNIHIQTHLDNIKSVFVAAFPMQGPMPYILETAFYNIYRKKGWDLLSSINIYSQALNNKYLYPILEDLYEEIDNVTDDVGYSKELTDDVKGALKVRIGSLLSGAKGAMLNTNQTTKIDEVLETPTIIELESIGDSQEKVFLMGLILTSMYEHYVSKGIYSDELQNLLVIEEAHRLLENTTSTNNNEIADMKGKALENFNNILSEIRAYGQGIVVADQIPSKLSPDVIKNTNLKIIHRLYANDDRELVGYSIGLEKEKINGFINLERGQAILFHSKVEVPIKVDIDIEDDRLLEKDLYHEDKETIKLEFDNVINNNDIVIKEVSSIINSYLISKNTDYIVIKGFIKRVVEKYYDAEIIQRYNLNINSIVKSILIKYVRLISVQKEYVLTYPNQVKFIEEIFNSEVPLEYFKKNINRYIRYNSKKEVYNLVNDYNLIRVLYTISNKTEYNILLLVKKYENQFKQGNYNVQSDIIRKLDLENIFKINNLSEEVKANLVDSLVIFYLNDSEEIINLYFGIGSQSKIAKLNNKEEGIQGNSININQFFDIFEKIKVDGDNQNNKLVNELNESYKNSNGIIKGLAKNVNIILAINSILVVIIIMILIFK